jgi:hypothetical protein
VFKHQAPAVNRFAVLAPSPIGIAFSVFAATAALLSVPMVAIGIFVDDASAPITPDDVESGAIGSG